MAALVGTGASVTFNSSILAEPLSINLSGATRTFIDATSMATVGGMEFIVGSLYDPGTLEIECILDNPDADFDTMMTKAVESVVITFANGNKWTATGGASEFGMAIPLEDKMTFTLSIKLSADWAHAAS